MWIFRGIALVRRVSSCIYRVPTLRKSSKLLLLCQVKIVSGVEIFFDAAGVFVVPI